MEENEWPTVAPNDDGIRPAGKPDECFYCSGKVGKEHARDCVCVTKRVKVRFTVDLELDAPHSWTADKVNFRYQGSSWCGSNLAAMVTAERDQRDADGSCMCEIVSGELLEVVDATPRRQLLETKGLE